MAAPSMTFNGEGDIRSSSSLGAGASASYDIDASAKLQLQLTIKNTPGGTVSSTRGVRVDCLPRYGTTPTSTTLSAVSYVLPSAAASTAESKTLFLGTGLWRITIVNIDAANAVTVEITSATVDSIS